MVYRLICEGLQARVCFLGAAANWRDDDTRAAVGAAVMAAGSQVIHFKFHAQGASSAIEEELQPSSFSLPAYPSGANTSDDTCDGMGCTDKDWSENDDVAAATSHGSCHRETNLTERADADSINAGCGSMNASRRWQRVARKDPVQDYQSQPKHEFLEPAPAEKQVAVSEWHNSHDGASRGRWRSSLKLN